MAALSPYEQLLLEMINRARLDPNGEAARYGITLNQGLAAGTLTVAAKQVLAPNALLVDSARAHSQWMINTDIFSHTGVGGSDPGARMRTAGYNFTGSWTWGENIAWSGTTGTPDLLTYTMDLHRNLFLSAGHRVNILEGAFRELGTGIISGPFTSGGTAYNAVMATENFATSGADVFVTGVAYNDTDQDAFYDVGEARGNVSVAVSGSGSDATEAAGGYAIAAASTNVSVTFSGGGLAAPVTVAITGGTQNAKVDLVNTNKIFSSVSAQLGAGAVDLKLLGIANLNGTGNAVANVLEGNSGNNILDGAAGGDTLRYTGGLDTLRGGADTDTADFSGFASAAWVDLAYGGVEAWTRDRANLDTGTWRTIADLDSIENVTGTGAADFLRGNSGANLLAGGAGDDTLAISATATAGAIDSLQGDTGLDTVDLSAFGSGVWVDLAYSGVEVWTRDQVNLASGTYRTIADLANIENIKGSAQADYIKGTASNNTFAGGAGADRFVFASNWGADRITDFQDAADIIDLSLVAGLDSYAQLTVSAIAGGTATVTFGAASITLTNLAAGTALTSADFIV